MAQLAANQIIRSTSAAQASHTTYRSTLLPCRKVALKIAATRSPPTACTVGTMRIAGCRRTVAIWCSFGSRYLLTATGPGLSAVGVGVMRSEGVDELRQRVARTMQPGENTMDKMSCPGGLSGQVVHDEGEGRP